MGILHLQMKKFDVSCQQNSCLCLNDLGKSLIYESGSSLDLAAASWLLLCSRECEYNSTAQRLKCLHEMRKNVLLHLFCGSAYTKLLVIFDSSIYCKFATLLGFMGELTFF